MRIFYAELGKYCTGILYIVKLQLTIANLASNKAIISLKCHDHDHAFLVLYIY